MTNAKVIVVGNEKGGSGKSTLSIHLAVSYLYSGYKVATIDLDGRQGTLTHYIENRVRYAEENKLDLPMPEHLVVTPSQFSNKRSSEEDEEQLDAEIQDLKNEYDIIIIDTPGTFSHLSNAGHKNADILVTPVNDSLVDIDVLANIDPNSKEIISESQYTENIREIQKKRADLGMADLMWIVLRNRISHIDAKNKREVDAILKRLQEKLGFTYISGIGERVVYREMFLKGLTILDLLKIGKEEISISHIAAKNELLAVLNTINIPLKQDI
ncbi:MAG: AAA family ATPase [Alphaproteobacteria bacterium]|nr:AAA family ATPase [Alphaproteobacteria bacterium]MBR4316940.1 AAA family ATPase [Alphaproteobacteria bacterium]